MFSQPSSVKIALLDVPRMAPQMILPALLCTDSMCACSSFVQLSKTISEYSKPDLINDLYQISSVFRLTFREMWLSMLILVFAVAQILSIWVPHFKFCCITMPRCVWCLTWDIGSSKKNKLWDSALPRKARVISHDLDVLIVTSHWFAHSSIIFRSADKISSFLAELLLEM